MYCFNFQVSYNSWYYQRKEILNIHSITIPKNACFFNNPASCLVSHTKKPIAINRIRIFEQITIYNFLKILIFIERYLIEVVSFLLQFLSSTRQSFSYLQRIDSDKYSKQLLLALRITDYSFLLFCSCQLLEFVITEL